GNSVPGNNFQKIRHTSGRVGFLPVSPRRKKGGVPLRYPLAPSSGAREEIDHLPYKWRKRLATPTPWPDGSWKAGLFRGVNPLRRILPLRFVRVVRVQSGIFRANQTAARNWPSGECLRAGSSRPEIWRPGFVDNRF